MMVLRASTATGGSGPGGAVDSITSSDGNILINSPTGSVVVTLNLPLTTKGDLLAWDSGLMRLPVGTNGKVLTANSLAPGGLSWETPTGLVTSVSSANAFITISPTTGAVIATFNQPLTTKGDLLLYNSGWARLGVGSNGQVLTANSAATNGVEWAAAATGGITQLTSDVTAGPGSGSQAATIANNAVTNAKLADVPTATFKGRTTASTGDPEDLTATQATALLNAMVGDSGSGGTKGLVPAPASGDAAALKFLKADGTWATTPAAGTLQINTQTSSSYTLVSSDDGKVIIMTNASSTVTVTVPSGLSVGFCCIVIGTSSTANVVFAASGTTINSYAGALWTAGTHAAATLISYSSNVFNLSGNIST